MRTIFLFVSYKTPLISELITYLFYGLVDVRVYTYYNIRRLLYENTGVIKTTEKNHYSILRNGSRHDIWYSDITGKQFSVPRHKAEIPIGTLNNILKDAGIK